MLIDVSQLLICFTPQQKGDSEGYCIRQLHHTHINDLKKGFEPYLFFLAFVV
jgi:hypothetical protein